MAEKLLWQDKLSFSERIIFKELEMISQFTATINAIKYNNYPKERINELDNYKFCWANINNLYDVLRFDYGDQLEKEELQKLDNIINGYKTLESKEQLKDLINAKYYILKIMSKAGFHNLVRESNESEGFGEF